MGFGDAGHRASHHIGQQKPKLVDRVRLAILARHKTSEPQNDTNRETGPKIRDLSVDASPSERACYPDTDSGVRFLRGPI